MQATVIFRTYVFFLSIKLEACLLNYFCLIFVAIYKRCFTLNWLVSFFFYLNFYFYWIKTVTFLN